MLQNRIDFEDIRFLDLFGGTGNHCYEMLSRGAQSATYVDKFPACVRFAKKMANEFQLEDKMTVVHSDVRKYVGSASDSYNLVFAGPPYGLPWLDDIPNLLFESNVLSEDALLILEHNPNHNFEQRPRFVESRNYGQTIFSFFE